MRWLYYIAVVAACISGTAVVIAAGPDFTLAAIAIGALVFGAGAAIGRWKLLWLLPAVAAVWLIVAALSGWLTEEDPRGEGGAALVVFAVVVALAIGEVLIFLGVVARKAVDHLRGAEPWRPAAN